jgi:hypothetical protein
MTPIRYEDGKEKGLVEPSLPLFFGTDMLSSQHKDYRHSFFPLVVYYRQSWQRYLTKNCADNVTVPITWRNHVE